MNFCFWIRSSGEAKHSWIAMSDPLVPAAPGTGVARGAAVRGALKRYTGLRFEAEGSWVPEACDVEEDFGAVELRLQVYEGSILIPGRFWLFGLADAGRVWVDGEDSNDWHPSFGGGLAVEVAGAPLTFWVGAARSRGSEDAQVYVLSGFGF